MASFNTSANVRTERVYRMSIWIRLFALVFLGFSLLGVFGLLWSQRAGLQGRNPAEMIEWSAITVFAAGWAAYVFSAAIVLSDYAIEKRTVLKRDELRFNQIRGRREKVHRNLDGSYIRYLRVIPRDPLLPEIKFQQFYAFDAAFKDWYNALPNLDAEWKENDRDRNFGLM